MRRISKWFGFYGPVSLLAGSLSLAVVGCAGPKRLPPVINTTDTAVISPAQIPALLGIGLSEGDSTVTLTSGGPSTLQDAQTHSLLFGMSSAGLEVVLTRAGNAVTWRVGAVEGRAESLRLRGTDPQDHPLWEGRQYRGDLLVFPTKEGAGLTLVNNVALEAYLQGVVPWEIGRHGQDAQAALAAQAVAARTYTISHLGERADHGFDLFAGIMDQVYKGATEEDERCNKAIRNTRGLVLNDRHGAMAETYYSACCGGVTSRIEEVWARPAKPYLVDHPDTEVPGAKPFCADFRLFTWTETWQVGELMAILQMTLPAYYDDYATGAHARWAGPIFSPRHPGSDPHQPGALRDIEILARTPSGRIETLAVTTVAGTYHVRGDRVRWVMAPPQGPGSILRSALFELDVVRKGGRLSAITAKGHGYGHGIGMCQAGALAMAKQGYDYADILVHYYPGTRLAALGQQVRP